MKKIFLFIGAFFSGLAVFAQTVPNGTMETWRTNTAGSGAVVPKSTIQAPAGWYGADSIFIGLGQTLGTAILMTPDTVWHVQLFKESTITHGGSYAAKLLTRYQDTLVAPGVLSNAQTHVSITFSPPGITGITYSGGASVTVKPTSVSAWVKYKPGIDTATHLPAVDSGVLSVQALAHIGGVDSVIGTGRVNIGDPNWAQVVANITYPADTVDSVVILRITFTSSGGGLTKPRDSSTLYVDDITMTSVPNPIKVDHTGISSVMRDETVRIYPNPASHTLYFDSRQNSGAICRLLSLSGQVVATKTLTGYDTLDIGALPHGLYFYTISSADGTTLQRGKIAVK